MNRKLQLMTLLLLLVHLVQADAGKLYGKITDERNKEIAFATVILYKKGLRKIKVQSDLKGNYVVTPIEGEYKVVVSSIGYSKEEKNVVIHPNGSTHLDVILKKELESKNMVDTKDISIDEVKNSSFTSDLMEVSVYIDPLIEVDKTTVGAELYAEDIWDAPARSVGYFTTTGGESIMQYGYGEGIILVGSGNCAVQTNGIKLNTSSASNSPNLPYSSFDKVLVGGLPAQYENEFTFLDARARAYMYNKYVRNTSYYGYRNRKSRTTKDYYTPMHTEKWKKQTVHEWISVKEIHYNKEYALKNTKKLTAGELNDFRKWKLWSDLNEGEFKQWSTNWKVTPLRRYTVQLIDELGMPVVDQEVEILYEGGEWISRSDNTGKAELWLDLFSEKSRIEKLEIKTKLEGETYSIKEPKEINEGVNFIQVKGNCHFNNKVDIGFVVDATGSMSDEINFLKAELEDIIGNVERINSALEINVGLSFYRDYSDEYVTRNLQLNNNIKSTIQFVRNQRGGGGGDYPEAVDEGLDAAINNFKWSKNARARILFLVLDAPPHTKEKTKKRLQNLMQTAAKKGIRVIPITASGVDKSTEFLMRSFALATNGTYVFLTDDSGIGNPHIKPSTDKYDVELLNEVMVRLLTQYTTIPNCPTVEKVAFDTIEDPLDSLKNVEQKNETITIYPNPTKGIINIENTAAQLVDVFVLDITGKLVDRMQVKEKEEQIDISRFSDGIYIIKFYDGEKWESKKIVLRH